jgi:cobalt-zinc-cadmium efflux system membrane fusion protein
MQTIRIVQAIFGLVFILILASCSEDKQTKNDNAPTKNNFVLNDSMAEKIELSEAKSEMVRGQLTLNGKISADENNVMDVFPLVGGHVREIYAVLGQYVKKGEVLAVIFSNEIAEFDKEYKAAQQELTLAEKSLKNGREMFEARMIAEKELLPLQFEVDRAKLSLKRIEESRKLYGTNERSEYIVRAPMSGYVIKKNISKDQQLRSDNGDALYTIAEINEVWALANVYESDISRINVGQDVQIEMISYPGEYINARIDKVFTVLDPESQTMKVRVTLPNRDYKLKPEMNCVVNVLFNETKQMIAVSSKAIIFDKSKNFVMVYKDKSNIETREVTVYRTSGDKAYISEGLKEGEQVISKEQLFIYDAIND